MHKGQGRKCIGDFENHKLADNLEENSSIQSLLGSIQAYMYTGYSAVRSGPVRSGEVRPCWAVLGAYGWVRKNSIPNTREMNGIEGFRLGFDSIRFELPYCPGPLERPGPAHLQTLEESYESNPLGKSTCNSETTQTQPQQSNKHSQQYSTCTGT